LEEFSCCQVAPSLITVQATKFKKYKTWDPQSPLYIVIVLSCPLIGSLSNSTANQKAAQNNLYIEPEFGDPSTCTTDTFLPVKYLGSEYSKLLECNFLFVVNPLCPTTEKGQSRLFWLATPLYTMVCCARISDWNLEIVQCLLARTQARTLSYYSYYGLVKVH
jgi:hypothetical protein